MKPPDKGKKNLQRYFFLCIISIAKTAADRSLDQSKDGMLSRGFFCAYVATASVTMTFFQSRNKIMVIRCYGWQMWKFSNDGLYNYWH